MIEKIKLEHFDSRKRAALLVIIRMKVEAEVFLISQY